MFERTHTPLVRAVAVLAIALAGGLASIGGASAAGDRIPVEVEHPSQALPVPIQAGPFTPEPTVPGITLTSYAGGTANDLAFELRVAYNERARAAVTIDGEFVTLIPGAPAFVNAAFQTAFPSELPAGTPMLVVVDPFPVTIQQELDAARAAWATSGSADYDVTMSVSCFCFLFPDDPDASRVTLEVRGGAIVAATTDTGTALDPAPSLFITVEALFDEIQEAIDTQAARVEATYHADGYPLSLFIDRALLMADEEIGYTIHELTLR